MPDPNKNQNDPSQKGGPNKKNAAVLLSAVLWALIITLLINYATSMRQQANTTEIEYGVFRQMVMDGKVSRVVMASDKYVIYPKVSENGFRTPDLPWRTGTRFRHTRKSSPPPKAGFRIWKPCRPMFPPISACPSPT